MRMSEHRKALVDLLLPKTCFQWSCSILELGSFIFNISYAIWSSNFQYKIKLNWNICFLCHFFPHWILESEFLVSIKHSQIYLMITLKFSILVQRRLICVNLWLQTHTNTHKHLWVSFYYAKCNITEQNKQCLQGLFKIKNTIYLHIPYLRLFFVINKEEIVQCRK